MDFLSIPTLLPAVHTLQYTLHLLLLGGSLLSSVRAIDSVSHLSDVVIAVAVFAIVCLGAPGTTECVPRPLIHSIMNEYLKVRDVFCGSPSLPSLEALRDRCDTLILVAFADEPQFSHHEHTIRKVETVRELANILFFRLSRWISFDFLDNVIEHFQPELKDVKEQLAQYKEKLKEILMQKLKHISDLEQQEEEKETSDGLELTEIVAKYRLDADGLKVQDLVTERDFMAQRLGIPEYLLQVLSWRPGSVIIVFLLLRELQPLVELTLRRRDVRANLTSHGVEAIFVSGCSSNLVSLCNDTFCAFLVTRGMEQSATAMCINIVESAVGPLCALAAL